MGAHRIKHALADNDNHLPGTANTFAATNPAGTALLEKTFSSSTTSAGDIPERGVGGHIIAPSGASGSQVPNVDQVQAAIDSAVDGLKTKAPVQVMNLIDDSLSAPPGAPVEGDAYVLNAAGTGLWAGFAAGDLVVWDGSAWQLVVANSGGNLPSGTRAVVTGLGNGTAAGGLSGNADAIATADGVGGWTFEAPQNGFAVLVIGDNDPNENSRFAYDDTPGGWVKAQGAIPAHNDTTGLQGGSLTERYHLTLAQHTLALTRKAGVNLAGVEPVLADLTTLAADGDILFGKGTGDEAYICIRIGTKKYAVELGEITV